MQKIINVLALASFVVSASVVGAGAYVYINREAIQAEVKERVTEGIKDAIGGQLGATLLGGEAPTEAIPELGESAPIDLPSMPF